MTAVDFNLVDRENWKKPFFSSILLLVVSLGGFLCLSYYLPIDGAISAMGTIVVENDRKVVQHLEGGVVTEIIAHDGQYVREGETLVKIDVKQAKAGENIMKQQLFALMAEEARLLATINGRSIIDFSNELLDSAETRDVVQDQRRIFSAMKSSEESDRALAENKVRGVKNQIDGIDAQIRTFDQQISSLTEEKDRISPLVEKGIIAKNRVVAIDRDVTDMIGKKDALSSEKSRLEHVILEAGMQIEQSSKKMKETSSSRLAEINGIMKDLREKLTVSSDAVSRTEIKSPRSGRVINMKVHTIGAVVRPGETIMEIVPDKDKLIISAKLAVTDVTHVRISSEVEIRFPSFRARNTPFMQGEVLSISPDAMIDEATRQMFYVVKISVDSKDFPDSIHDQLRPGMVADVMIKTGERTIVEYLMQPFMDSIRHGMKE